VVADRSSFRANRLCQRAGLYLELHRLLSGIRHFIWDLGYGFKANERETLTWGALIGGVSLTVLLWIAAYAIGGGR
jgi:succinate dehydrogenase / fumarate reductase, cytochrome b subunit